MISRYLTAHEPQPAIVCVLLDRSTNYATGAVCGLQLSISHQSSLQTGFRGWNPFSRLSTPASWWRRPPLPPLVAQRLSGPTQGAQDPFTPTPSKRILCRRIVTLMGNCTKKDFLHSAQHSQFLRKWHRTAQTFYEGSISQEPSATHSLGQFGAKCITFESSSLYTSLRRLGKRE